MVVTSSTHPSIAYRSIRHLLEALRTFLAASCCGIWHLGRGGWGWLLAEDLVVDGGNLLHQTDHHALHCVQICANALLREKKT